MADALTFVHGCCAVVQGSAEPNHQDTSGSSSSSSSGIHPGPGSVTGQTGSAAPAATAAPSPQPAAEASTGQGPSLDHAEASPQTEQPAEAGKPKRKQRKRRSSEAGIATPGDPFWEPDPKPKAWGVLSMLFYVTWPLLLVICPLYKLVSGTTFAQVTYQVLNFLCWPAIWLTTQVGACLGLAWVSFAALVAQTREWQRTRYRKRGRVHRAQDKHGTTVHLTYASWFTGRAPKKVDIYAHPFTWHFASRVIPARALLLLMMLFGRGRAAYNTRLVFQ